jgi:hypothetical protein
MKGDALVGVSVEEAVDEVLGLVRDGDMGGVGVLASDGVPENLRDAVVVEGQVASQPACREDYM